MAGDVEAESVRTGAVAEDVTGRTTALLSGLSDGSACGEAFNRHVEPPTVRFSAGREAPVGAAASFCLT